MKLRQAKKIVRGPGQSRYDRWRRAFYLLKRKRRRMGWAYSPKSYPRWGRWDPERAMTKAEKRDDIPF